MWRHIPILSKLSIPQPPVEPPVRFWNNFWSDIWIDFWNNAPVTAEEEAAKEEAEDAFEEIVSLEDAIGSADNEDDEQEQITNALLKPSKHPTIYKANWKGIRKNYSFQDFFCLKISYTWTLRSNRKMADR